MRRLPEPRTVAVEHAKEGAPFGARGEHGGRKATPRVVHRRPGVVAEAADGGVGTGGVAVGQVLAKGGGLIHEPADGVWSVEYKEKTDQNEREGQHNRLFDTLGELKGSIRNSLRYFQAVRSRVKTLLKSRKKRLANQTASPGS